MELLFGHAAERPRAGRTCHRRALSGAAAAVLVLALSPALRAQGVVEAFFNQYCSACHTIGGGPFLGPDLKDVTKRQDRIWLVPFMLDPDDVIASGDPYASKLVEASDGLVMPRIPELTPQIAEALLDFIEARSGGDSSQAGVQTSDQPFTTQDIEQGRRLFFGEARLLAGGTACFSCHSTQAAGMLGGGRLGPDLSQVYGRLRGRRSFVAWLSAPPAPTMRASYGERALKPDEVHALVAFFEAEAKRGGTTTWGATVQLLLFSASGAVLALLALGGAWRGRFRAVRRPLVRGVGRRRELWR